MSYILDALRRADAERERGHVPGIHAQPTWTAPAAASGADPRPTGRRRDAVAIGLILLLALFGWLTWRALAPDGRDAVGSDAGPVAQAPIAMPASPVPARSAASDAPAPVAEAPPPERPVAVIPVDRPTSRPARKPVLASAASAAGKGATAGAAPATKTSPPSGPASAAARIYRVEDLPEDIRRDVPKLAIGGSIYSESPASRFIIVNGQLLHEGDTVAPGLVLQQIRLKSAVLAFRGYQYGISY